MNFHEFGFPIEKFIKIIEPSNDPPFFINVKRVVVICDKKDLYDKDTVHYSTDKMLEECKKGPHFDPKFIFYKTTNWKNPIPNILIEPIGGGIDKPACLTISWYLEMAMLSMGALTQLWISAGWVAIKSVAALMGDV